jgi:predicted amidohydrolase
MPKSQLSKVNSISKPKPESLRVAAVQMICAPSIKENLAKIQTAAARAAKAGADVILFPECATTSYAYDFGSLKAPELRQCLRSVSKLAAHLHVNLLVGTPIFSGGRCYNGLAVFNRAGELVHVYAKCQLTEGDRRWFTPGSSLSLFAIDGIQATAMICHERRYPELVRLPVMAGAQVVFHPNAGMDRLAVSKAKRRGRDGIVARAFENAVYYVFANTVGPQGGGKWSAGDSKIVAPDTTILGLADNSREAVIVHDLELAKATRKYALDSLKHPRFLAHRWPGILTAMRRGIVQSDRQFRKWFDGK